MADTKKKLLAVDAEKMLGAFVPEELFWEFKKAAADRKEKMSEAMINAAYLYISIGDSKEAKVDDK